MTLHSTTTVDALIELAMPGMHQIARKYAPRMQHTDYDDILGMCYERLVVAAGDALNACDSVDRALGYLYRAAENNLINYWRLGYDSLIRRPGGEYVASLDARIQCENGSYTLGDLIEDDTWSWEERDYDGIVARALERLDGEQKELVERRWGIGANAPESVYALQKSTKRSNLHIQKVLARALSRLREDRELAGEAIAC